MDDVEKVIEQTCEHFGYSNKRPAGNVIGFARKAVEIAISSLQTPTVDVEATARELLAAELDADGHHDWARDVRRNQHGPWDQPAIRAISKALQPKPTRPDTSERDAVEVLAQIHEIGGNKAAAFTLRKVGAVGCVLEDQVAILNAWRTPPPSSETKLREAVEASKLALEEAANILDGRGMNGTARVMRQHVEIARQALESDGEKL